MLSFDFTNKIALVTGGNGGIGSAIAKLFLEASATVVCVDLKKPENPLENCHYFEADVSSFDSVENCISQVIEKFGKIDFLINNAGISRDSVVWKMSENDWNSVLDVNLKGAFNFIRQVSPHFKTSGFGKIVNVSSINGMRGKFGLANYSASKAGLIGLTKTVAKELGKFNVNVNAVAPGIVGTNLVKKLPENILAKALTETVLNRFAEPEDVAKAILFLCSDFARHITGEVIKVDGGQYI
ncbi:MAG: SDR family NAD(P)-dependent oxidoreductase [Calditrichaeota bacterium]|nr:MAG: SDR family NAD(P)-dependent oxidoreductase [Calditrichota bacterium]